MYMPECIWGRSMSFSTILTTTDDCNDNSISYIPSEAACILFAAHILVVSPLRLPYVYILFVAVQKAAWYVNPSIARALLVYVVSIVRSFCGCELAAVRMRADGRKWSPKQEILIDVLRCRSRSLLRGS